MNKTVYIVGAGFSAGLGYPLTANLLVEVWRKLSGDQKKRLKKVIQFHHPNFDPRRNTSFPTIETLLTEISVNLDMFAASRPTQGSFERSELKSIQAELLTCIARWFHSLYEEAHTKAWLQNVIELMQRDRATVISFNWDLILDHCLFEGQIKAERYGLGSKDVFPVLLKPHGSLNWYLGDQAVSIKDENKVKIHSSKGKALEVWAFLPPRHVKTSTGRIYTPFIIPPTFIKDFSHPISGEIWRLCTEALSTASKIVILGYSLPEPDLQAKFIFRCGFHNQVEGTIRTKNIRNKPSGAAEVVLISPDSHAAKRIESVIGKYARFTWEPMLVEEWASTLKAPIRSAKLL